MENFFIGDHPFWLAPSRNQIGDSTTYLLGLRSDVQSNFSEIIMIHLPPFKQKQLLKKGDLLATIESTKSAIDLEAPCDMELLRFNQDLLENPEVINSAKATWLAEINLSQKIKEQYFPKEKF